MGLTTEMYSQATTAPAVIVPKSFLQEDDTVNMQCRLCASYFQDHSQIFHLIRHPQFSTKKSRIKTPNFSVIREQFKALM
jgi:hypothetical protein